MKIGKDAVVMGNISPDTEVGDGSVVIGSTDAQGNTIINQPMAVGRNAQAGPQSIAIGAGAGFNTSEDLTSAVAQIQSFIDRLQQQGKSPEEAQSEVAQNIATQAQNDPTVKEKLIKWGQSIGTATVTDVVKGAVKLAIRLAGIPIP
jgi:hypothetical protein